MCMTVKCAQQSNVHASQMCMTVKFAWQSNVHDSKMCMTVKSAWQSLLKADISKMITDFKIQTGDGLTYSRCSTEEMLSHLKSFYRVLAGPPKSQSHYFEMHPPSKCSFWCIETFLLKKFFILRPPTMGPSMGPICTLLPLTVPYYIF